MKKRLLAMLLCVAMVASLLTVVAAADSGDRSGTIGSNTSWYYDASENAVTISGSGAVDGLPYEDIAGGQSYFTVDKLIVGEGITSIANFGCSYLEYGAEDYLAQMVRFSEVELPASLNEVVGNAFSGRRELTSIVVNAENKKFFVADGSVLYERLSNGQYRLVSAPSVEEHNILEGTTQIGDAFVGNVNIKSIVVPEGEDNFNFQNCASLTSLTLPSTLTRLDSQVIWGCVNLARLDIPSNCNLIAAGTSFEGFDYREQLTLYFHGSIAPTIVYDFVDMEEAEIVGWNAGNIVIFYPEYAVGWDKIINRDYSQFAIEKGFLEFHTWVPVPNTPQIIELSPASGATISETASTDFMVTYDTPISVTETSWGNYVNLDFSKGSIEIHRSSDDYVIYTVEENDFLNDYFNIEGTYSTDIKVENGNTLVFSPFNVHTIFDSGAEYYITMDEGVFAFANGASNPEIKKGDWTFSTGQGTFKFLASDGTKDLEYTFDFTEDYFNVNSYYYNHDLAKTSLALALSAFNSYDAQRSGYDKSKAAQNVIAMLRDMGFEDINVDSYEGRPTANSIAQAIGHKSINTRGLEYTVLAVAIRGGGYEAEWSNNFQVGSDRHHIGFDSSANTVVSEIIDYIENELTDKEKENLKIWITGYSRGAAVANLTGHKINTLINNSTFDSLNMGIGDVYVYTFATPMGTAGEKTSPKETNIYNIVNPVDVVPKLAPSAWEFYRYGVTYMLPSQETDSKLFEANKSEATDIAGSLTGKITTKAITWQASALDSVLEAFDLLEPDGSVSIMLQNTLAEHFEEKYRGGSGGVGLFGIIKDIWSTGSTTKAWLSLDLVSLAKTYLLKPAILDGAAETLDQVLSTVEMAHYPETYLAWMYALDAEEFGHGIYRKDYINCPVDVAVYDENGNNVAGFTNEEPYFDEDGYVTAHIDHNGQKVLVFPNDREYRVEITPYDEGTLSYTVEEYSTADNETRRVVSYQSIPIEIGDKFHGVVSEITNPENETLYTFSKDNEGALSPTIDQSGSEIEEFTVSVSTSGNGEASGGGTFLNGEYVLLSATANSGASFIGWYVNGALISNENEVRILVNDDMDVVAKFSSGISVPSINTPDDEENEANEPGAFSFTDVPSNAWYYDYVQYVVANGLMEGTSATTFEPEANMTRAMLWTILARIDGEEISGANWQTEARDWAMTKGVSDGTDPNGLVTREQFATMLYRYAGEPDVSGNLSAYTDASIVSDWAQDAMTWAVSNGIITGVTATTLDPQGTATRAQAAAMLMRFVEL